MRKTDLRWFLDQYDTLLVDMDGVLTRYGTFFEHAIEVLNAFKHKQILICTNSVRRTPELIASRLCSQGFIIDQRKIFTGSRSAVSYLQKHAAKQEVYLFGCGDARYYFEVNDINLSSSVDNAAITLLGAIAGEDMTISHYTSIVNKHLGGGLTIATSEDLTVPDVGARHKIGTGFISLFLKQLSTDNYVLVGKPSAFYFTEVLDAVRAMGGHRALMIGDTYETDIMGANRAGIDTLYVTKTHHTSMSELSQGLTQIFALNAEVTISANYK